ncbi:MAG: pentapeptide repeat-containing protein [Flavonifractor plautii]
MLEEEVRRARREERDVEDVTVEGECLAGADLSGLEFRRVRLHRCRFQNCDFSGAVFDRVEWSGCDFSNCRFGGTVWTDTVVRDCKGDGGRFTASRWRGLHPGRERLPLRQFCTVAVEKVLHGELPASPGRAGRGGCGRPEPTPDGVPGGGLFSHAAEGDGFFRRCAGGHHCIGEPGRAAGHEDQPGPGGGSDPPAGGAAFVREERPMGGLVTVVLPLFC